jgi:hypothetical protein
MRKKYFIFFILLIGTLFITSCSSSGPNQSGEFAGITATVYKSPTCGCCVGYSAYLEEQGFTVEIVSMKNMDSVKERYNIPSEMESCHTTVIGEYFIEGHVPIEGVKKLLDEKPTIDGIALPRMPIGSPGMPGVKKEIFNIRSLTNGKIGDFTTI